MALAPHRSSSRSGCRQRASESRETLVVSLRAGPLHGSAPCQIVPPTRRGEEVRLPASRRRAIVLGGSTPEKNADAAAPCRPHPPLARRCRGPPRCSMKPSTARRSWACDSRTGKHDTSKAGCTWKSGARSSQAGITAWSTATIQDTPVRPGATLLAWPLERAADLDGGLGLGLFLLHRPFWRSTSTRAARIRLVPAQCAFTRPTGVPGLVSHRSTMSSTATKVSDPLANSHSVRARFRPPEISWLSSIREPSFSVRLTRPPSRLLN